MRSGRREPRQQPVQSLAQQWRPTDSPWSKAALASDAAIGLTASTRLTVTGVISGSFGLTKVGPGTAQLAGTSDNTFTGLTSVNDGTLTLNKSGTALAVQGDLTVGDGVGGAATVRLLHSNQAATTTAVTVKSDGTFDLNGFTQTVASLTMSGPKNSSAS